MQIDQEALATALDNAEQTYSEAPVRRDMGRSARRAAYEDAITAYLTALASQEGAQAGEVVKQWRHKITRSEWSGWYDGEPVEYLSKFGHVQRRTLYTTPPAPDEALRAAVEAERRVILGLIAIICGKFSDCSASFVCDRIDEAIRARKGGAA